MNFRSKLFRRFATFQYKRSASTRLRRLSLEKMEDRRLMAVLDLATLTPNQGTEFVGVLFSNDPSFEPSVASFSSVGDMNGDGYDEVIVAARSTTSYLVFGRATPPGTVDLSNLGTAGVRIEGDLITLVTPVSYSSAGDMNGDGFDDLAIGFYNAGRPTAGNVGKTYVIYGSATLPTSINLNNLGTSGFTIVGANAYDRSGSSVSSAGDMNGDGFDDLIIGAPSFGSGGANYVVFGRATLPVTLDLANLGTAGVTIFGEFFPFSTGDRVRGAGDVNGDGFDDVVLSGRDNSELIFGSATLPAFIELDNLGTAGINFLQPRISPIGFLGYTGLYASSAGDLNGDGFDDLAFKTFRKDPGAGPGITKCFVVLGSASLSSEIDLSQPAAVAVKITGNLANINGYLDSIGDVNADGFDDLIIGTYEGNAAGHVIFGSATLPPNIELSSLGAAGIAISPIGNVRQISVSDAGDVNGDGFDDLMLGAYSILSGSMKKYVIFGGNSFTASVTRLGSSAPNTLTGTTGADVMVGEQGVDTLLGNGGMDVLLGGSGDDVIVASDLSFQRIFGGPGKDTLQLVGSGLNLDLSAVKRNRIRGIETVDITGNGNNTLTLNYVDVLNLSDTTNTLVVRGDAGDRLYFASGWTQRPNQVLNGDTFKVFTQGRATLHVQLDVVVNQSPVIAGFAGQVTATQSGPSILLDTDATLTDADSDNFASATLTVEVIENAESVDRLNIRSFGNTLGKIGVSGSTVKYSGVTIGTFTNTSKLLVSLNSSATTEAVQALIRSLAFSTTSNSTLDRTIRVTLNDGYRGSSQASKSVHVIANNFAPRIGSFGSTTTFSVTSIVGGSAVSFAPTATVTDADTTNFANAKLSITTTANVQSYDAISIDHNFSGCCNADGPSIRYGDVVVATETGGVGATPKVITFNSNATAAIVQDVLRSVKWESKVVNQTSPSTITRTLTVSLTDGDGGTSNLATKQIQVVVANLTPRILSLGRSQTYTTGSPGRLMAPAARISNSFSNTSYNGGKLTINTTLNGEATDQFYFRSGSVLQVNGSSISYSGVVIGTFVGGNGLTPLVVTFNANANLAKVQSTLNALSWKSNSASPSLSPRTFSVTVSDGLGSVSLPVLKQIILS